LRLRFTSRKTPQGDVFSCLLYAKSRFYFRKRGARHGDIFSPSLTMKVPASESALSAAIFGAALEGQRAIYPL
jgi:hypothetical protein